MFYKNLLAINYKLKKVGTQINSNCSNPSSTDNLTNIDKKSKLDRGYKVFKNNHKGLQAILNIFKQYNVTNKVSSVILTTTVRQSQEKILLAFAPKMYKLLKKTLDIYFSNKRLYAILRYKEQLNNCSTITPSNKKEVISIYTSLLKYYSTLITTGELLKSNTALTFYRKLRIVFMSLFWILKKSSIINESLKRQENIEKNVYMSNSDNINMYTCTICTNFVNSLSYFNTKLVFDLYLFILPIIPDSSYNYQTKYTMLENSINDTLLQNYIPTLKDENSLEQQLDDFFFKFDKDPFTKLHSINDYGLDLFNSLNDSEDYIDDDLEDNSTSVNSNASTMGGSSDLIIHKTTKFSEQNLVTTLRRVQQDFLTNVFREQTTLIYVNYVSSIPVSFLFDEGNYILRKFPFLVRTRVASQIVGALLSFLKHKDPRVLLTIIVKSFTKTHYSKHKPIFKMWEFFITQYSDQFLASYSVAGLKLEFRGKLAVGGNARKRAYIFRTGLSSNSAKITKSLLQQDVVSTATGTFSCNLSIFF